MPTATRQYQKPGFQVKGDTVYRTDAYGHVQYQQAGLHAYSRMVGCSRAMPYGNPQYQKPRLSCKR